MENIFDLFDALIGAGQAALAGNKVIRNTYLLQLLGFMNSDD